MLKVQTHQNIPSVSSGQTPIPEISAMHSLWGPLPLKNQHTLAREQHVLCCSHMIPVLPSRFGLTSVSYWIVHSRCGGPLSLASCVALDCILRNLGFLGHFSGVGGLIMKLVMVTWKTACLPLSVFTCREGAGLVLVVFLGIPSVCSRRWWGPLCEYALAFLPLPPVLLPYAEGLRGFLFSWANVAQNGNGRRIGLVAQNVRLMWRG